MVIVSLKSAYNANVTAHERVYVVEKVVLLDPVWQVITHPLVISMFVVSWPLYLVRHRPQKHSFSGPDPCIRLRLSEKLCIKNERSA